MLIDPGLDLSIATLAKACKGNVKLLPSFMVHTDETWPVWNRVQLDSQNRIHMRRTTFLECVCRDVPVRAGLWLGADVQQFFIDLQPHHLQGTADMPEAEGYKHSRPIAGADEVGRTKLDEDFNAPVSTTDGIAQSGSNDPLPTVDGEVRGVRSTALHTDRTE